MKDTFKTRKRYQKILIDIGIIKILILSVNNLSCFCPMFCIPMTIVCQNIQLLILAEREGQRGQFAPGPQAPRGLIN